MSFKVDSSFLKFVTMGALGTLHVSELMTHAGLQPIELERYSRSNKIWSTKVKRLRLPDLLCVRTGLRVEVRAKSKLAIKMSDTPSNPERRWNSGLKEDDMVAFIHIHEDDEGLLHPANNAELFWIRDLVATEQLSRLGPAKSASEGAERDREWPSTVPTSDGNVQSVAKDRLSAHLANGRNQTYRLGSKTAYIAPGEAFLASSQFLAVVPTGKASFPIPQKIKWNPRDILISSSLVDRYVAVKSLGFAGNTEDRKILFVVATNDPEERVALEASAALIRLGDERGLELIQRYIDNSLPDYLSMEAILILSEFRGTVLAAQCADLLVYFAQSEEFRGKELRQAAIWGLGKDGLRTYNRLLGFLDLPDNEELVHAVCAFGPDMDISIVDALIKMLLNSASSERQRASASYVLAKIIAPVYSVPRLVEAQKHSVRHLKNWILATLGQMNPATALVHVNDANLASQLEWLYLTALETNWTRSERVLDMLGFIRKQTIILP